MALYAFIGIDKPDGAALRAAKVAEHMAYLRSGDVVKLAGPFTNDHGGMIGSLLIIEADSQAEAETWLEQEPFAQAGLFAKTDLYPWFSVVNGLTV